MHNTFNNGLCTTGGDAWRNWLAFIAVISCIAFCIALRRCDLTRLPTWFNIWQGTCFPQSSHGVHKSSLRVTINDGQLTEGFFQKGFFLWVPLIFDNYNKYNCCLQWAIANIVRSNVRWNAFTYKPLLACAYLLSLNEIVSHVHNRPKMSNASPSAIPFTFCLFLKSVINDI